MSYVRAQKIAKRLKQNRRVSGADLLRKELDLDDDNMDASLLNESSEIARTLGNQLFLDNNSSGAALLGATVAAGGSGGSLEDNATSKISRLQMSSADFEEWIKLATDNKINSTNSWNFALIDYFHEMSLLKEGDNINFQKASATLDGCVKIYSSRVDSIATETGRLLTGLATKKNENGEEGENGEAEENGGHEGDDSTDEVNADGSKKKKKLNKARMVDSTVVNFDTIRMKKLDQELEIDPLFKRALSEFDEGGAKSLLLNILNINTESRIVFDAAGQRSTDDEAKRQEQFILKESTPDVSDGGKVDEIQEEEADDKDADLDVEMQNDSQDEFDDAKEEQLDNEKNEDDDFTLINDQETQNKKDSEIVNNDHILAEIPTEQSESAVLGLKSFIYNDIDDLKDFELCPSMKSLDIVLKDINQAKTILSDVNNNKNYLPLGHGSENSLSEKPEESLGNAADDDNNGGGFMNDLDFGYDDNMDNSFGSANDEIAGVFGNDDDGNVGENNGDGFAADNSNSDNHSSNKQGNNKVNFDDADEVNESEEELSEQIMDRDLMAYFDQNMRVNWAGPEHWKVSALKKRETKLVQPNKEEQAPKKPKKQEFKIDFLNEIDLTEEYEELIFKSGNRIDLPKVQQVSENNNLLPKDIFFGSERLLKLFCKPDNVKSMRRRESRKQISTNIIDENKSRELAINEAADENYWASKYKEEEEEKEDLIADMNDGNDFFDGGFDDMGGFDTFADIGGAHGDENGIINDVDAAANGNEAEDIKTNLNIGANLIAGGRRIRPEYVNFSRTAKRVDVKYLKNNLWKSVTYENAKLEKQQQEEAGDDLNNDEDAGDEEKDKKEASAENKSKENKGIIKFTNVVDNIGKMYSPEEKKDLSTSFCFICMLHLANEHGLTIENEKDFSDLNITYNDEKQLGSG